MPEKLFARWWFRILFFLALSIFFALIINISHFITGYYLSSNASLLFLTAAVIFASGITESMRPGGVWYLFGLNTDKFALKHFLFGMTMGLIPMILFLGIFYAGGTEISITSYFSVKYFFNGFILILTLSALEELFFRGIIFQALGEKFGFALPAVVLSLIFSSLHFFSFEFKLLPCLNTFLAGVLFSIMYVQTKSLILPISFHFSWNFFQTALLDLPLSGNYLNFHLLVFENHDASKILFGGLYGVEGGLVTTLFLLILTAFTFKLDASPRLTSKIFKRKYAESSLIS